MISSIIKRVIGITLFTIAVNVLFLNIDSDGFSNINYIISMIVYSFWIIVTIERHIDTEVTKGVDKLIVTKILRDQNNNDTN